MGHLAAPQFSLRAGVRSDIRISGIIKGPFGLRTEASKRLVLYSRLDHPVGTHDSQPLEKVMKRLVPVFCSAYFFALLYSGGAVAQSLVEQGMAGAVGAGALYGATQTFNPSGEDKEILIGLQQQGYSNIVAVPSVPSQYTAFHPSAGPVLVTLDPSTGQILSVSPR